ncbi:uncharacterized protein LOC143470667 isoform X3 [Clavelina lepadiformis]|uniref:uncharacterized protein LOC143470667 isoform X3 n=1 Tax=Clavelina lepadiformis TaxID=159417 RepID=UPI0040422523
MANTGVRPDGWTPKNDWENQSKENAEDEERNVEEEDNNLKTGNEEKVVEKVKGRSSSRSESPKPVKFKKAKRDHLRKRSSDDSDDEKREKKSRKGDKKRRSRSPRRRRSASQHRHDDNRSRRRRNGSREHRRRSKERTRKRSRSRSRRRSSRHDSSSPKRRGKSRRSRSRSRDGNKSDDEKKSSPRKTKARSRSRSRKRSSSRSRRRRSRSRDHKSRRSRSRGRRKKERSKSPQRAPSKSRRKRSRSGSPYRFGMNQAMDAQERLARRLERAKELTKIKKEEERKKIAENSLLGLKDDKLKEAIEKAANQIVASATGQITPQTVLSAQAAAQMDALKKQAEAETGISVPSYYNPLVVNPMQYAQQQAKRKKLWSKKEDTEVETTSSKEPGGTGIWSKMSLGDNKSDEKFAKLMGIKHQEQSPGEKVADEEAKKRQELFSNLDQQYEQARVVTHTQRGAGLGFASTNPNTLLAQQANQQLNTNLQNTT